jgi:hypothetical protein
LAFQKEVIRSLPFTILVEGAVGLGYALWHKKPVGAILITSVIANLITQSLLWIALLIFFQHYLAALWIAEVLIWALESLLFHALRSNQLSLREALFLSLVMNLSSFGLGWFLPM